MFGLQALVNIGVVLGALPTKGLPLPFVSFGGSTLVVDLFAMGILLNISRAAPEPARRARQGRLAAAHPLARPTGQPAPARRRQAHRSPA